MQGMSPLTSMMTSDDILSSSVVSSRSSTTCPRQTPTKKKMTKSTKKQIRPLGLKIKVPMAILSILYCCTQLFLLRHQLYMTTTTIEEEQQTVPNVEDKPTMIFERRGRRRGRNFKKRATTTRKIKQRQKKERHNAMDKNSNAVTTIVVAKKNNDGVVAAPSLVNITASSSKTTTTTNTAAVKNGNNNSKNSKDDTNNIINNNNEDDNPRPHPHKGARYPNGTWGYVADVYAVRRHWQQQQDRSDSLPSTSFSSTTTDYNNTVIIDRYMPLTSDELTGYICGKPLGKGDEGPVAGDALVNKVVVGSPYPEMLMDKEPMDGERYDQRKGPRRDSGDGARRARKPRILCVIYTIEKHHDRVKAIGETWGHRCDGFFAASTHTDPSIGAVDLPHEGIENYANMWQKTRSIWSYVYHNYLDEFDYFHLGGDDMHLIVENMIHYLSGLTDAERDDMAFYGGMKVPQFWNAKFRKNQPYVPPLKRRYYMHGAPGYTINRRTLAAFVEKTIERCFEHAAVPNEDRFFSDCVGTQGIKGNDTTDARNEQRYWHVPPEMAVVGPTREDGYNKDVWEYWEGLHGVGQKLGRRAFSSQTVSMHWLRGVEKMKRHHAILYRSCPEGTVLADSLDRMVMDDGKNNEAMTTTTTMVVEEE